MTRTAAEFARIYHSLDRVDWIRAGNCEVCGASPCDNAHLVRIGGGVGRKGGYRGIGRLCPRHHREQHAIGSASFQRKYGLDFVEITERTQREWEAYVGE